MGMSKMGILGRIGRAIRNAGRALIGKPTLEEIPKPKPTILERLKSFLGIKAIVKLPPDHAEQFISKDVSHYILLPIGDQECYFKREELEHGSEEAQSLYSRWQALRNTYKEYKYGIRRGEDLKGSTGQEEAILEYKERADNVGEQLRKDYAIECVTPEEHIWDMEEETWYHGN